MTTNRSTRPAGPKSTGSKSARSKSAEPTQLRLLDGGRTKARAWQLDARTRRIGRERVAEAREILRRARPPEPGAAHKIAG